MIKYVNNAFLGTKISFANEIGNLCKANGIDAYEVFRGVGMDRRINPHFFRSGIGFGGSCFPKDIHALIAFAESQAIDLQLLKATLAINDAQPRKITRAGGRRRRVFSAESRRKMAEAQRKRWAAARKRSLMTSVAFRRWASSTSSLGSGMAICRTISMQWSALPARSSAA